MDRFPDTPAVVKKVMVPLSPVEFPVGATTVMAGKTGTSGNRGQELGRTNGRARLSAQMALIWVSCGVGLGTRPRAAWRKKASCRASLETVEARFCISAGSVLAVVAARFMTAPIPTDVIIWASLRKDEASVTGN